MKGLLIKDICILLRQKTTLLVIVLLGIFMSTNGGNVAFSLGYLMMVAAIMVANTIYYDYFEKGMSFLLTLPVDRKMYVLEKFLMAFVMEVVVAGIAVLIHLVGIALGQTANWAMFAGTAASCMIAAMLVLAVYIPVNIKCGPEKSRIAMLAVFGVIAIFSYLGTKVESVKVLFQRMVAALSGMTPIQVVALGLGALALVMAISIVASVKILEKKEF